MGLTAICLQRMTDAGGKTIQGAVSDYRLCLDLSEVLLLLGMRFKARLYVS